jgi:hypothetical protein
MCSVAVAREWLRPGRNRPAFASLRTRASISARCCSRCCARQFEHEVQKAFVPFWLQRLALAPLAWLAKRRGYDARYRPAPAQPLAKAA